jgi:hypothetical protein
MNDGGFSRRMGRKIRAAQRAKRKAQTTNGNLSPKQWPAAGVNPITGHTELSAMYDNDGNAIHPEPKGYTSYGQ